MVTAQGKPGIPDDVETDPFAQFIRLKWKEPKLPNGVIIKYHLFINKDAKPRNVTVDGNTRMYYFGGLVPQTGYILSIQAETKASIGNRKTVTETTISPQGKHSIFVYRIVLHAFVYFVTFEAFRSSGKNSLDLIGLFTINTVSLLYRCILLGRHFELIELSRNNTHAMFIWSSRQTSASYSRGLRRRWRQRDIQTRNSGKGIP